MSVVKNNQSNGALAASENTPLLVAEPIPINDDAISSTQQDEDFCNEHSHTDKPLPIKQILILCYARLVEPIAFFGIFPFINKMIQETGHLDEEDVGFYSGSIVCSYLASILEC